MKAKYRSYVYKKSRLDARSGVQGTGSQSVNGEPMDRSECKGCLWIDLDERIRRVTFPSEGDKVPAAGGVWTILEVQNFAKNGALQVIIHSQFLV